MVMAAPGDDYRQLSVREKCRREICIYHIAASYAYAGEEDLQDVSMKIW